MRDAISTPLSIPEEPPLLRSAWRARDLLADLVSRSTIVVVVRTYYYQPRWWSKVLGPFWH